MISLTRILAVCLLLMACKLTAAGNIIYPAFIQQKALPTLEQMSKVSVDATGDAGQDFLDIQEVWLAYSDSYIYTALKIKGTEFKVSGMFGTQKYSYMVVLANPEDDSKVWALTYIMAPMAKLKPGLFRVEGMDVKDLTRIGNIEYRLDTRRGILYMACKLSYLLEDPAFAAWFTPYKKPFAVVTQTNLTRILPYKTGKADSTYPGARISFKRP